MLTIQKLQKPRIMFDVINLASSISYMNSQPNNLSI